LTQLERSRRPPDESPQPTMDEGPHDPTLLPMIQIASDVPDLGTVHSVPEFWGWCNRQRETLHNLRQVVGLPAPAQVAGDEFRIVPEIVRLCRNYLLGFGAGEIPVQFAFASLPLDQEPTGPGHFPAMERFITWACGYRLPGHGLMKLIREVEEFLTWAMNWCQRQGVNFPDAGEEAPAGEEADAESVLRTGEALREESWIFAPSGNGFFISGFGESGHLKGLKGLGILLRLLQSPGNGIPMVDLVTADKRLKIDRQSPQAAIDEEGLKAI